MYYQDHMGAGRWVFMALVAVVLLGLLAAFVVWLVRDQRQRPHRFSHVGGGSALEILDRRLATGEIGIEEYERVKASLVRRVPEPAAEPPVTPSA